LNTFNGAHKVIRHSIGIDIGRTYIRAVQVAWTHERFIVEKTFCSQVRRSTDSPPEVLSTLFSHHGFDRHADLAVALAPGQVYFRNVQTDLDGVEKIASRGLSELENEFPLHQQEVFTQICSQKQLDTQRYSVLVAATRKASLNETLNVLGELKKQPQLAQPSIFAVYSSLLVNYPEIAGRKALVVHLKDDCIVLAVIENGEFLMVRHIPFVYAQQQPHADIESGPELTAEILAREAKLTWRKVFGAEPGQDNTIYLAAENSTPADTTLEADLAERLDCQIIAAKPYARLKPPAEDKCNSACGGWVAEGLALALLSPEITKTVNLLEAGPAGTRRRSTATNLKKDFATCLALAACIALVWFVGLFIRLSFLEAENTRLEADIKNTFLSAVGDQTKIVNPLAQLDEKLSSLRKEYRFLSGGYPGRPSPLEVLQHVTNNRPENTNITVDDLLIGAGSVRLSGLCRSFDTVYQWQKLLQNIPSFESVEVGGDLQYDPKSGDVRFSILVSTKAEQWLCD